MSKRLASVAVSEATLSFVRSSGPGGQHVNTSSTKAQLRWDLKASTLPATVLARVRELYPNRISKEGVLQLSCQRFRSRELNAEDCKRRLAELIVSATLRQKVRKATRVPRGADERRIARKKVRSAAKKIRQKKPSADD